MSSGESPVVSHGRGGVANIGQDSNTYTDGEIVREGPVVDQGDGAYSAGRGGVGNIGSPGSEPAKTASDHDFVTDSATRLVAEHSHHTGRGGEGNIHHHHDKEDPASSEQHEGLADKLKHKITGKR